MVQVDDRVRAAAHLGTVGLVGVERRVDGDRPQRQGPGDGRTERAARSGGTGRRDDAGADRDGDHRADDRHTPDAAHVSRRRGGR
jgi:hypothetical protein